MKLEWLPADSDPDPRAVWAFTSIDGYRRGLRLKRAADGSRRFTAARMVPPNLKLLVIYQVGAALRIAPGAEVEVLENPAEVELRACPELPVLVPPPDQDVAGRHERKSASGMVEHQIILRLGTAGVVAREECATAVAVPESLAAVRAVLIDDPDGCGPVQLPRVTETEFRMRTQRAQERAPSFWACFRRETDVTVRQCLDLDFSKMKIGRLIDDSERTHVQTVLARNYRKIISIYRFLSALGVGASGDGTFGVSQIDAADAWIGAGLVDGETTKVADVDRLLIAAKVPAPNMKTGLAVRNDKSLVRHQFLELILRLADQRFLKTGAVTSIAEAVNRILDSLGEVGDTRVADMEAFFEAFHREEIDNVFKKHDDILRAVFRRYSGQMTPPGLTPFMSLSEFQRLLEVVGAYDAEFQQRKSAFAFRMGMMTQSEECYSSRFQEMSFVEFLHAIGAVVFLRAGYAPARMAELCKELINTKLVHALPRKGSKSS